MSNLSVLTASIGDGVYVLDREGRVTFMNAAAEEMLGWKTEELRGKAMHDQIHYRREDGTPVAAEDCPLLQVLLDGTVVRESDDVFIRRDGTVLPIAYTSAPVTVNGRMEGAVLVFRDTTREKLAAAERQQLLVRAEQGEKRLQEMIDAMPVQVWTAAPDGTLDFISPQMLRFTGKPASALVSNGLREMMHPSDERSFQNAWQSSLASGEPLHVEARLLRARDFRYLWHIIRAVPCRDQDGSIREWISTNADNDAERRATEVRDSALARAQVERERLMRVFINAPAVMAIYRGPDHIVNLVNPMWEKLFNKTNVIGRPLREVFPELEEQGVIDLLDRVYTTGELYHVEEMRVFIDLGSGPKETYWSFVLQQLKSPDDKTVDVLAFAIPVTSPATSGGAVA